MWNIKSHFSVFGWRKMFKTLPKTISSRNYYWKWWISTLSPPTIVKVNRQDIEVDNRWVVPFSPLLCKAYKAHINVEFWHTTPYCCSLGLTFGKWSTGVFYKCKRITTSWQVTIDNINQLLRNVPEWWFCQNATLLRNAKILYLESIIKKIPTTKTTTTIHHLDTLHSLPIFVTFVNQRPNSWRWFSQTLLKIT